MSLAELADRFEAAVKDAQEPSKTVLGLPVHGEPIFNRTPPGDQWGEEEFSRLLRPLIESDDIAAIRWTQFTPYFNDGDVCEFSLGDVSFKVDPDDDESGDNGDGFLDAWDAAIKGGQETRYVRGPARDHWGLPETRWEPHGPVYPQHPQYEAMKEFNDHMWRFESYLYDLFGDHAAVTVHKDRIEVEYYEHD